MIYYKSHLPFPLKTKTHLNFNQNFNIFFKFILFFLFCSVYFLFLNFIFTYFAHTVHMQYKLPYKFNNVVNNLPSIHLPTFFSFSFYYYIIILFSSFPYFFLFCLEIEITFSWKKEDSLSLFRVISFIQHW